MKKSFLIAVIGLCVLVLFLIVHRAAMCAPRISLVTAKSYLNDWYIEGDYVYLDCHLVIQSQYNDDVSFRVIAFSEEDFQSGLVSSAKFECKEQLLHINSDSKETAFDLLFVGPRGETQTKTNRLLPATFIFHSVLFGQ